MKILVTILLVMLAGDQLVAGYRILGILPLAGKSHHIVMEQLLLGLARKGHQVDMMSHFPQKKPVPNFTDISLVGTSEFAMNNMSVSDTKRFSTVSMYMLTYMTGEKLCGIMEAEQFQRLIKNPPTDPPYDLVITELFSFNCYLAFGRYLNVPVVGVAASSLLDWLNEPLGNPVNTAHSPSIFSSLTQDMTFWERMKNTFMVHSLSAQVNYYLNRQTKYVKQYLGIELNTIHDLYEDIALVLVNSHHSLHGVRPFSTGVIEVGGMHVTEEFETLSADVQKWLDEAKHGCVLFTFGSMVRIETLPPQHIDAIYKSFEKIAPVRVLMKVVKAELLPPGLPKNVMTKPWFAQKTILNHKNTKAFITHGGLMGTMESIYFGVPMIGVPIFGDQPINIMNYVKKNVAVSLGGLNNITEESLSTALKTILEDKSYGENVKKLSKLFKDRPMKPLDTAIFWVEYVCRHGKILQSPAVRMTWVQRNLLDVYGAIAAVVITILLVVYLVLKTIMRWLCSRFCSKRQTKETIAKKNK